MEKKKTGSRLLCRLLSFLLPAVMLSLGLLLNDRSPFGSKSTLIGDCGVEYYPMLLLLRRALHSGEGLLYTWRLAMGGSFLPEIAYFCISPFTIPFLFLPEHMLQSYLSWTIIIRIGLAGLSFCLMLETVRRETGPSAVWFSAMYALSAWVMTSFWQTVWLDSFVLTPLVMAGVVRLVRDRDFRLYTAALGLTIACNYYLSFLICCMTGLVWIGVILAERIPRKQLLREAGRFLGFSLLAASFSAVILLPTAAMLSVTSTAGERITDWTEVYCTFGKMVGQLCSFSDIRVNQHPANVCSSIMAVCFLPGYLLSRRIPLRERLYGGALAAFLLVSLWYAPLSYVWHGFHFPHVTGDRFAFLLPMVLAYCGWRFTLTLTEQPEQSAGGKKLLRSLIQLGGMAALTGAVLWCADAEECTDIVMVPALLAGFYLLLCGLQMILPRYASVCTLLTALLVTGELGYQCVFDISLLSASETVTTLEQKPSVQQAVTAAQKDADENGVLFCRTALTEPPFNNADLFYDIPGGITAFTSLIPSRLKAFAGVLGYKTYDASYAIDCVPVSPFALLMTDVRYVISKEPPLPFYQAMDAAPAAPEQYALYRPAYDTAFGFCIPQSTALSAEADTFTAQNRMFSEMTGETGALFEILNYEEMTCHGMTAVPAENGMLRCKADAAPEDNADAPEKTEQAYDPYVRFVFRIPEDGCYYLNRQHAERMTKSWCRSCRLLIDGVRDEAFSERGFTADIIINPNSQVWIGELKKGQTLELEYHFMAKQELDLQICAARFSEQLFEKGHETLMQHPMTLTAFSPDAISGTVSADHDCMLYLTVPYDRGWSAEVDGRPEAITELCGAMTGVPLKAGSHTVSLRFRPRGLIAGCAVSVSGLLGYCILSVRRRKKQKSS